MKQNWSTSPLIRYSLFLTPLIIFIIAHLLVIMSKPPVIKIGLIHALTGSMNSKTEQSVLAMELFAIEQLNKAGGLLGCVIEPVIKDFQGNTKKAATLAQSIITNDGVNFIFGGSETTGRRAISGIVEQHKKLYFCAMNHPGLAISENTVFCNHTANQNLTLAMHWGSEKWGSERIFLLGADIPYSRISHGIAHAYAKSLNNTIAGEAFLTPNGSNITEVVDLIKKTKPTFIVNTAFGLVNIKLIKSMYEHTITAPSIWIRFSFSHLPYIDKKTLKNHFLLNSYFDTIKNSTNESFITTLREKNGYTNACGNQEEAAYMALMVWAQAVNEKKSFNVEAIQKSLRDNFSIAAPDGPMFIDPETLYAWKNSYIAHFNDEEKLEIIWQTDKPIRPDPFPYFGTQDQWKDLVITGTNQSKDVL